MLKLLHLVDESFVLFADEVFSRDSHVVKKQFGRITAATTHFIQLAADLESGQVGGNQQQAEGMITRVITGSGQQRQEISLVPLVI